MTCWHATASKSGLYTRSSEQSDRRASEWRGNESAELLTARQPAEGIARRHTTCQHATTSQSGLYKWSREGARTYKQPERRTSTRPANDLLPTQSQWTGRSNSSERDAVPSDGHSSLKTPRMAHQATNCKVTSTTESGAMQQSMTQQSDHCTRVALFSWSGRSRRRRMKQAGGSM